jgi:hypothetical protein
MMSVKFISLWYIILKVDVCIAVSHNILFLSRQHMLHISIVLTILRHNDASLTTCKDFCRIRPVVVYHFILTILRPEDGQYDRNM